MRNGFEQRWEHQGGCLALIAAAAYSPAARRSTANLPPRSQPTNLYPLRDAVARENAQEYKKLKDKAYSFEADDAFRGLRGKDQMKTRVSSSSRPLTDRSESLTNIFIYSSRIALPMRSSTSRRVLKSSSWPTSTSSVSRFLGLISAFTSEKLTLHSFRLRSWSRQRQPWSHRRLGQEGRRASRARISRRSSQRRRAVEKSRPRRLWKRGMARDRRCRLYGQAARGLPPRRLLRRGHHS